MQDDPRSQEEELLTSMDQVTLAKFVECFPFLHHEHLPGQMLDCETLYTMAGCFGNQERNT